MGEPGGLEQRLNVYMLAHGLKHTRQRQVLLDTFVRAGQHLAIDDLLVRAQVELPSLGYATVYRTLKLFVAAGIAHERRFHDGQTRFEAAELGQHHDHLICRTCGHIFEFEDPLIESRQDQVARDHGLSVVAHRHDIYGECQRGAACEYLKAKSTS